jgi:hypothetical protein
VFPANGPTPGKLLFCYSPVSCPGYLRSCSPGKSHPAGEKPSRTGARRGASSVERRPRAENSWQAGPARGPSVRLNTAARLVAEMGMCIERNFLITSNFDKPVFCSFENIQLAGGGLGGEGPGCFPSSLLIEMCGKLFELVCPWKQNDTTMLAITFYAKPRRPRQNVSETARAHWLKSAL